MHGETFYLLLPILIKLTFTQQLIDGKSTHTTSFQTKRLYHFWSCRKITLNYATLDMHTHPNIWVSTTILNAPVTHTLTTRQSKHKKIYLSSDKWRKHNSQNPLQDQYWSMPPLYGYILHLQTTLKKYKLRNTTLSIATGCTFDNNIQHLNDETNILNAAMVVTFVVKFMFKTH